MTIANGIIDSYGALKAALTTFLVHSRWVDKYALATTMFEATGNHRLRVRPMETSADLVTVDGEATLPTDYLLWRTVLLDGNSDDDLDYVHPAYLTSTKVGDRPGVFTIEGNVFKTNPVDDTGVYEFHYYQKLPTITGSEDATNWLLLEYPNVYLFGVLVELAALQRNAELATLYKGRRDELFTEIIQTHALTTGATSQKVRETEHWF